MHYPKALSSISLKSSSSAVPAAAEDVRSSLCAALPRPPTFACCVAQPLPVLPLATTAALTVATLPASQLRLGTKPAGSCKTRYNSHKPFRRTLAAQIAASHYYQQLEDAKAQQQTQPLQDSHAGDVASNTEDAQAAAGRETIQVLGALCQYAPMDLADGPASLSKVRPYNALDVQRALDHAKQVLPELSLQHLSNMTAALAAAGHLDHTFMQQLGDAAAARLKAAPRLMQHTPSLRAFRTIAWLAAGFSRLGVLHLGLMEQIAVYGAHLLQRCPLAFSKRRHGHQLALLAASFPALQLYPPQLFKALGEHLKRHKQVVQLLGPQESMLVLWAFAHVGHKDPPALLMITQRAATQVGQLTCAGLAHAYSQCAAANISSAPLLAALRKATRVKLNSLQPTDLTALLTALAALGQQDLLYLDEIARAVFNKLANFTAVEVGTSITALAALRYRNSWLLDQASRMMVSRRLRKAYELTPEQLADVLQSCHQLRYINPMLLGHLGSVAVEAQLPGCSPAQLVAVVQGFGLLVFQQPQLMQAAAARLLQLVAAQGAKGAAATRHPLQAAEQHTPALHHADVSQGTQQQQMQEGGAVGVMASAALQLAAMPSPAGTIAEAAVLPTALLGITAQALGVLGPQQHQQDAPTPAAASVSNNTAASLCSFKDLVVLQTAILLCISTANNSWAAGPAAAAAVSQPAGAMPDGVRSERLLFADVLQQLSRLQQDLLLGCLAVRAAAVAVADSQQLDQCLLPLMQLLWLQEQVQLAAARAPPPVPTSSGETAAAGQEPSTSRQQVSWRLGLLQQHADAFVQQHLHKAEQQLRQQQGQHQTEARALRAVAVALTSVLQQHSGGLSQPHLAWQVLPLYHVPNSPVVVPVAALPAVDSGNVLASNVAGDTKREQGECVVVHAPAQLHRKKLQLPPAALEVVTACQHSLRPLAVFVVGLEVPDAGSVGRPAGIADVVALEAWQTSNVPHQLLPAARLWKQGLLAAGWNVLVLHCEAPDAGVEGQ